MVVNFRHPGNRKKVCLFFDNSKTTLYSTFTGYPLTKRIPSAENFEPNLQKFPKMTKKRADFNIKPAFLRLFDIFDSNYRNYFNLA